MLPDCDPKAIAEGLFWGAFINTGQTCAALKRLYVHDSVFDEVVAELTAVAGAMPMGEGTNEDNVLGPLQNKQQFDIVARLVESARAGGGRVVLGGNPEAGQPGYFYPATLVADVPNDNPLAAKYSLVRFTAAVMPPAESLWLSFNITISYNPMR